MAKLYLWSFLGANIALFIGGLIVPESAMLVDRLFIAAFLLSLGMLIGSLALTIFDRETSRRDDV